MFKNKKLYIAITLFFIIISIIIDFINLIICRLGYSVIQLHVIQTFRLWTWFSYFMLGTLISSKNIRDCIYKKLNFRRNIIVVITLTIVIVFYQYNISRYVYHLLYAEYFYDNIFTFLWILSLFLFIYRVKIVNIRIANIIKLISINTMGIYIIHVTILNCIHKLYSFKNPIINILMIFIIFSISLIISIIINKIPYVKRLVKL